jgi:hypothetical protein
MPTRRTGLLLLYCPPPRVLWARWTEVGTAVILLNPVGPNNVTGLGCGIVYGQLTEREIVEHQGRDLVGR